MEGVCKQSVFRLAGESSIGTEVGLRDSSKYTVCLGTFGCGEVFVVFVGTVHHSGVTRQQYWDSWAVPSNHESKAPHFPKVAAVGNSVSNTASKSKAQRTVTATIQRTLANMPQKVRKSKLETSPKPNLRAVSMKNQKVKRTGGNGKELRDQD